jgi:hypothetical protein
VLIKAKFKVEIAVGFEPFGETLRTPEGHPEAKVYT